MLILLIVAMVWTSLYAPDVQNASFDDLNMGTYVDEPGPTIVPCRISKEDLYVYQCLVVTGGSGYFAVVLDDMELYI